MTPLTIHELRLTQAELAHRAERLRAEWRTTAATSNRALSLGKQVQELDKRAAEYARLVTWAEAQ
jgi:hypothetical protein